MLHVYELTLYNFSLLKIKSYVCEKYCHYLYVCNLFQFLSILTRLCTFYFFVSVVLTCLIHDLCP